MPHFATRPAPDARSLVETIETPVADEAARRLRGVLPTRRLGAHVPRPDIRRILVPVDFTPEATTAIAYAGAFAQAFGAAITLLHVYDVPDLMAAIVPGADVSTDLESTRLAWERELERRRAELRARAADVQVLIRPGAPAKEIVQLAAQGQFDLIVMGTHGRSGLDRLLVGSVAESVLRRAPCAVVIVRPPVASAPA